MYNNEVYFVEINPRFQASTILLNIALNDAELPCIQMLQLSIFDGKTLPPTEKLENIDVNYSLYKYKKEFQDDSKQYLNKLVSKVSNSWRKKRKDKKEEQLQLPEDFFEGMSKLEISSINKVKDTLIANSI